MQEFGISGPKKCRKKLCLRRRAEKALDAGGKFTLILLTEIAWSISL